jgi:hypothetical protein
MEVVNTRFMSKNNLFGFILLFFLGFSQISFANDQFEEDERLAIQRMSENWAEYLNSHQPARTAALYENHISLYATFKVKVDNYRELVAYLTRLTNKKDFKVVFDEENIRIYGPTAVNSGLYTFSYKDKENNPVIVPARFTFVYTLTPQGWRIVEHHSSELPE